MDFASYINISTSLLISCSLILAVTGDCCALIIDYFIVVSVPSSDCCVILSISHYFVVVIAPIFVSPFPNCLACFM